MMPSRTHEKGESMTGETTLVLLHGVGTGDPEGQWKTRLSATLESLGYPGLDSANVIAPRYAHALTGFDEPEKIPPLSVRAPAGDEAKRNRRDFERRMAAVEFRLGSPDRGSGYAGGDAAVDFAIGLPHFIQARNYLQNSEIRARVLNFILSRVPSEGKIVLVGHSLGSVIAADLVRRLPTSVEVVGMVTVGSPLASESFGVDRLRENLHQPPANLHWWVSFWDAFDPVAARRGVSSAFPWMIDFQVKTTTLDPVAAHQAVGYFGHDIVAEAIGFALFGSRSKEVARIEHGIDVPLDAAEVLALLALRYSHLAKDLLKGDTKDRYAGALRNVQAVLFQALAEQRRANNRPSPTSVVELAVDLADPTALAVAPVPARHLSKEDAVVPLTVISSENVILPYEIELSPEVKQKALEDLTAEMGLGSAFGADLNEAAKEARETLAGAKSINWFKWGAIGAGAAALVVATGGLALAAAPGLVGAAAITSALAAFGPGGMIGGLLTAGTLVSAGGGGIAFGLASPETSAATLEGVVARQLTAEILRKRQALPSDTSVWRNLTAMEMELRREYERFDEFSDSSSPSMKELKLKIQVVERSLAHLTKLGLAPAQEPDEDGTTEAATEPWYRRVIPIKD